MNIVDLSIKRPIMVAMGLIACVKTDTDSRIDRTNLVGNYG